MGDDLINEAAAMLDGMDEILINKIGNLLAADHPESVEAVSPVSETTRKIVRIAQTVILIGATIDFTNTDPNILTFSAVIKLGAGLLFIYAALRESMEQQLPGGRTTIANKWKTAGAIISSVGGILLFIALLRENAINRLFGDQQQATIPVFIGGTGAFSIS